MAPSAFIHLGVRHRRIATRKGGPSAWSTSCFAGTWHSRTCSIDDEEGQGLAEYALILALIAIVAIVALMFLGGQISAILSNIGKAI